MRQIKFLAGAAAAEGVVADEETKIVSEAVAGPRSMNSEPHHGQRNVITECARCAVF